jgi:hypothetical protein
MARSARLDRASLDSKTVVAVYFPATTPPSSATTLLAATSGHFPHLARRLPKKTSFLAQNVKNN